MCGCLSGVKPLDKFWTEVLLDNFSDMVKDRILYADVKKYETAVRSEMTELNNAAHAILINIYCMNFRKTNTICCCSIRMARRTYKSTDCWLIWVWLSHSTSTEKRINKSIQNTNIIYIPIKTYQWSHCKSNVRATSRRWCLLQPLWSFLLWHYWAFIMGFLTNILPLPYMVQPTWVLWHFFCFIRNHMMQCREFYTLLIFFLNIKLTWTYVFNKEKYMKYVDR